jgi:integrase
LDDLVQEKLASVRAAEKCPQSAESFVEYVEGTYFVFARQSLKPSTVAGYRGYWDRYLRPRVDAYALRDFTVSIVASLLKDIAHAHRLNTDTLTKVRSTLSGIFSFAICEGHFPARSAVDNPARGARIPAELTSEPQATVVASRDQVQALLKAFEKLPLERAAIALMAFAGLRPNEARGLDWQDWERSAAHLAIRRGVWHTFVGTTKTEQSEGFVTVTDELREILLDLWREQGSPISGFILAGTRKDKNGKLRSVNLDNLAKRSIRDTLKGNAWPGWYALRRFHATQVCVKSDNETAANALRNSKEVAKKHYIKPATVLPKTRQAVNDAFTGLVQ